VNLSIGCSGEARANTGIGVVQRALYPRLERMGLTLHRSETRDLGSGFVNTPRGMIRGLTPARGSYDVYLSAVPPLPINVRTPIVSIVYDLRWRETRGAIARAYRANDLARTVARSNLLLCISERTRDDLIEEFPRATHKSIVTLLGPGLASTNNADARRREPGLALLIGGARHKRNELAVRMLAELPRSLVTRIAGIGVSQETQALAQLKFGDNACEWYQQISDEEVRELYARAEYFVLLSNDEGFGLPYIEALTHGCHVVATRQALTDDLLGDAGILLHLAEPHRMAAEFVEHSRPSIAARHARARRYDWDVFAEEVADALIRAAHSGPISRSE